MHRFQRICYVSVLFVGCIVGAVQAGEVRAAPGAWIGAWNPDPLVILNLAALAVFYGAGLRRLWRRAGSGRVVRRWHAAVFGAALFTLVLVLLSPLDALAADRASMHMLQHLLLIMVAAPLFVLGAPGYVLAWGLPREWPKRLACEPWLSRLLWNPWLVWITATALLWGWHHPLFYQAALRDSLVHDAQHLSFFVSAVLFWRILFDPLADQKRLHPVLAVPYLFAASLQATVLGVFMALAPAAWYSDYAERTPLWGITALEDQQLAGLIMWIPGCLAYPAIAAALFGVWLSKPSNLSRRVIAIPRRSILGTGR